ncbi:MAG TPA: endonuclease/exonuclease/phosphatase family protein [Thermoanaerobaculia bacterium]|nr:endonuclease/exonuclease/phosphatase family protein [Thermoanaerobaculia bacterium]
MRPTSGSGASGREGTLSVMSYNIQGHAAVLSRRYLAGVARAIRDARPDVVGLQEVHRGTWASRFADQVEMLAEATGMEACFGRSLAYRTGEYGNALLTRGRPLETEVRCLPGEAERRSLLCCRVELDGAPLEVFVTHLAAWGRLGRTTRLRQARYIASHLAAADGPFVLAGDLNAPPGAPELAPLLGHRHLSLCGRPREATHRLMRQRLDYVFAGPSFREVGSRVLRAGPSDHLPVVASLRREAPAAARERCEDASWGWPEAAARAG